MVGTARIGDSDLGITITHFIIAFFASWIFMLAAAGPPACPGNGDYPELHRIWFPGSSGTAGIDRRNIHPFRYIRRDYLFSITAMLLEKM